MRENDYILKKLNSSRGFTLLEVVVVLVLLGILTAVAMARMDTGSANVSARSEAIKSHLRYAQMRAMNFGPLYEDQHVWGVNFPTASTYYIFHCNSTTCTPASSHVLAPGEETVVVNMSGDGVSVGGTPMIVAFDRFGRPFSDASLATALNANLTITASYGSYSDSITIIPESGLIQ